MSARRLAGLVVVAVTLAAHASTLGGDFVYDDHRFIEFNTSVRSVPLVEAFTDPSTASHGAGIQHDIYRPLRTILFALEFQLFASQGDDGVVDFNLPWWHLVSVLLHALNAWLVFRLLRVLLRGSPWPAALGAAVFGVHPLTSESVAWLSSQGDLLAMTLLLTALVVLERPGTRRTVGGAALFLAACLAKESALMLPLLLPLRDLVLPPDDAERPSPWARLTWIRVGVLAGTARLTWIRVGVLAGTALLYLAARLEVLPGLDQVEHTDGSVLATARGMLWGLAWYARSVLLPLGFSFDTRIDVPMRWTDPEVWIGLGVLGTIVAAGVWGLRRRRYLVAFAALGFLVALGPVSNVIVPLKTFVADRFLYPGLLCVAAAVAAWLGSLRGTPRFAVFTVAACAVVALGGLTLERSRAWADDLRLWERVREERPWNANAYQGIGYHHLSHKRIVQAENALSTYLEVNPFDGKTLYLIGNLFGEQARGLVHVGASAEFQATTDMDERRSLARYAQIRLYQRALEIWRQPGGLALGRGSMPMLLDMLNRWIDAGRDLGDIATTKFANDEAIDIEAGGRYTHEDAERVWAEASWLRRRTRLDLALRAVRATDDREIPVALRERVLASRAAALADVGLDPSASSRAQVRPLIRLHEDLVRDALRDRDVQPDVLLFADLARLCVRDGDEARARKALEAGLRVHPGHPFLRDNLQALRR